MRIGVSSSGRWWVSFGPLGWLVLLARAVVWLVVLAVWLLLSLAAGVAALIRAARTPGAS